MRLAGRHEPTGPPGLGRARARVPRRRRRRAPPPRAAAAAEAPAEGAALHAPAGAASDRGHGGRRQAPRRGVRALRAPARQHGEAVSALLASVGAVTLFVADSQRSKAFYERAFDLSPVFEDENSVVFKFDNTIINLLNDSEAGGLIAPAAVASRDAGSRFQLSI